MNKNFFDINQKTVIKILATPVKAEKELAGAKAFTSIVNVPKIIRLDNKTLSISFVKGVPATEINQNKLNNLIIDLFELVYSKPNKSLSDFPNIFSEIRYLKDFFANKPQILKILIQIEEKLIGKKLFPVHGDLQKQNIFIKNNKITLIDFEHFIFAPLELEIVNSLFFNDENCLDREFLINNLIKRNIFSYDLILTMLDFYCIRQMAEKRDKKDCNLRVKRAKEKINMIIGKEPIVLLR